MELKYPVAIIICLILGVAIFFIRLKRKTKYTSGKKVANTQFVKETEYYKSKVRKYNILSNLIKIFCLVAIVVTSILIARPITIQTKTEEKYNRDILLSLDISTTQSEVNLKLIDKFREIMPDIKGDRIGLVIYNTSAVVYCPLTDDYDYLLDCFEEIEEQLQISIQYNGNPPDTYEKDGETLPTLWMGGVGVHALFKGSSLVGDGLASTLYSFPDLKDEKERTRIIIFATDNDVRGIETVTLDEACDLCQKYNVNLYAYCPTVQMNQFTSNEKIASYKKAVEQNAKGKFYTGDLEKMSTSIVEEIKNTKASLLKSSKKTYITDHPEAFFICILIVFLILIIIEKRIRL